MTIEERAALVADNFEVSNPSSGKIAIEAYKLGASEQREIDFRKVLKPHCEICERSGPGVCADCAIREKLHQILFND